MTLSVGECHQDHRRQQHQRSGEDEAQRVHLHRRPSAQHEPHDRGDDGHQRPGGESCSGDFPSLQARRALSGIVHLQRQPEPDREHDEDQPDGGDSHASGLNVVLLPVARPRPVEAAEPLFDEIAPHGFSPPRKVLHKYTRKASP
jgi:hypothetical protein